MAARMPQRLGAEFLGSALLLATVIGSGIMGERLSGGIVGLALLGNSLATGAILFVIITALAPLSGAHFNPTVTLTMLARREMGMGEGASYIAVQIAGAFAGVLAAHVMFDLPLWQLSEKVRDGGAQWFSEGVATFGLLVTILLTRKARAEVIATSVALYITAAYWFTASTSFANPAVTIARAFSDTFAGIGLSNVPAFIIAQLAGALAAALLCGFLLRENVTSLGDHT
jgi:glycerol uptake facilitator-like aquaporin